MDGRRLDGMPSHGGASAGAGKGRLAGQHLEQHAGQAVEIAPAVQIPLGAGLLRAHVGRRAHRKAAVGDVDVVAACGGDGGGHAEVGHHRLSFLQQDVLRLDVAVDDVEPMGIAERGGDRPGDPQRRVDGKLAFALQPVAQSVSQPA